MMDIAEIERLLNSAYRDARAAADAIRDDYQPRHGSAEQDAFNHAGGGAGALSRAIRSWRRAVRDAKGEG